jgi:hypothetical protein
LGLVDAGQATEHDGCCGKSRNKFFHSSLELGRE